MADGGATDPAVAVKVERKMKELIEQVKLFSSTMLPSFQHICSQVRRQRGILTGMMQEIQEETRAETDPGEMQTEKGIVTETEIETET